ncbi:MAG: hypothetical protein HY744_23320 [Deltaproteobacteria bacterium]|nr:hypothetical protein [Deltaproteobacteria bacterium]
MRDATWTGRKAACVRGQAIGGTSPGRPVMDQGQPAQEGFGAGCGCGGSCGRGCAVPAGGQLAQ